MANGTDFHPACQVCRLSSGPSECFSNCAWLWKWLLVLESPSFHVITRDLLWERKSFRNHVVHGCLEHTGASTWLRGTYVPTWLPHQVARASFPCACIRDLRSHVVKTFVQVMCFPNYRFIPHPVRAVQATYVICSPYPLGYFPSCLLLWWYFSSEQKSLVSPNQKVRISQHTVLSSLSLQPKTSPNSTLQSRNLFSWWYIWRQQQIYSRSFQCLLHGTIRSRSLRLKLQFMWHQVDPLDLYKVVT